MKVRSTASGPKRRGKPDDELIKAKKGEPEKSIGSSPFGEVTNKKEVQERSLPPSLQEASLLGRYLRMEMKKKILSRI